MIVPLPKSQTRHPVRAQAPLHLPHMLFWHTKTLQTPPPVRSIFRFTQPRSQGLFPGLGEGREKTLASAGHVSTLHPEILGVIN